jgi:hypothetical protein
LPPRINRQHHKKGASHGQESKESNESQKSGEENEEVLQEIQLRLLPLNLFNLRGSAFNRAG